MRSAIPLVLALAALAGGCDRRSPSAAQGEGNALAGAAVPPPAPDEVAPANAPAAAPIGRIDRSHAGTPAPAFAFTDPAGKPVTLAAYRGKPVLVNLWATWCAPCVAEMPTLDALAKREGDRLHVLAIAQDLDPAKVAPFWREHKLTNFQPALDPELAFSTGLGVNLPTTILYDRLGREVWRVSGGFDWAGREAKQAIDAANS